MNSQKLRLALTGASLFAYLLLHGCSGDSSSGGGLAGSGDGGGESGDDSGFTNWGASSGFSSGGTASGASGSSTSSSGGGSSSGGASSTSSGGVVYTCMGCIDTSGRCNTGTADNRCGLHSSTCVD